MGNYIRKKRNDNQHNRPANLAQEVDSQYFSAMSALAGVNRTVVYVEGYADIAFWRNIFDRFSTAERKFQIMTPVREDLAKGKKVVLSFAEKAGPNLLLCVDSDFDYLFPDSTAQAQRVAKCPFLLQTYAYAIENLQCYPPSLQSVAVKATKTDIEIFDFDRFFHDYSLAIYPAFLWYAWAASESLPEVFSLSDFKNTVRINFLDLERNGAPTIDYLRRQVAKRLSILNHKFPNTSSGRIAVEMRLSELNITPAEIHFYMQGHTLLDNVVKIVLSTVCEALRRMTVETLDNSRARGVSHRNQVSYYNNSIAELDSLLADNMGYMESQFYQRIHSKLEEILA